MRRVFCLIFVFVLILAVVSCGDDKKKKPAYEEQVTKEVSAEEGGKVESKDGKTSIEIPAGALSENTRITMTIYDPQGYKGTDGKEVISEVVEFEPSGLVFTKPVFIRMKGLKDVENKVISAAVYRDSKGEWSYSPKGAAVKIDGKDAAGDPIMTTAAGDPIMLSAAGDPIMTSAAGDPIMLSAAGDPIMVTAAGDPIMNAAAGDPIMMTTGHFTAYTFIAIDSKEPADEPEEPVEEPDDNSEISDKDIVDEPVVKDEDEIVDEDVDKPADDDDEIQDVDEDEDETPDLDEDVDTTDEDETPVVDEDAIVVVDEDETPVVIDEDEIVVVDEDNEPEPPVYSKVLCTGQTRCSDGESIIDCPAEGEDFYGQDAQFVAAKMCVVHKYSSVVEPVAPVAEEEDPEGTGTGLRNILHGDSNTRNIRNGVFRDGETGETYEFVLDENTGLKWVVFSNDASHADAKANCENLTYGGHTWRLPKVKELLSISDHDRFASATDEYYFRNWGDWGYWADEENPSEGENYFWVYNTDYASLMSGRSTPTGGTSWPYACVSGEEYGKINPDNYIENGDGTVFDSSTNLLWQKDSVPVKNWKAALAYCQNLNYAGYSDWRLPNKNELVTIVDYSKVDPASSFPGITSETLISSTFSVAYGGAENAIAVDMKSGWVDKSYSEISVRCVRSSSHPLSEGIPDCDESRVGPCKDTATGYVWSSAHSVDSNYSWYSISWLNKAIQCRESSEGGILKWRIPTIDEVRTLLTSSENLKTGGECKVTTECFDYATPSCFTEECSPESGRERILSSLFDYSGYITGTLTGAQDSEYVWFVNLKDGVLERKSTSDQLFHESRCIKDDSLPDPIEFPYEDPASGLVWSSLSKKSFPYWYNTAKYCMELVEGGSNNWRVPTMEELRTLIRNCDQGDCTMDLTGKYSVLGDIGNLWSSDVFDNNDNYYVHSLKFLTVSESNQSMYYNDNPVKVRCVRSLSDPETVSELEFPFEIGDLIWSKVSDEEYDSSSAAAQYCDSLNADQYGGRNDWALPSTAELAALIKRSVCSNKDNFLTGNSSGRCTQYTFEGYSVFGDMIQLTASNGYVDFAEGYVSYTSYPSGFARCIVVLPDSGS